MNAAVEVKGLAKSYGVKKTIRLPSGENGIGCLRHKKKAFRNYYT